MSSSPTACADSSTDVFNRKKRKVRAQTERSVALRAWARVGMQLTFRAEVMPGRERERRTFTVARVLANGRVELMEMFGQHAETEFEVVP